MALLGPEGRRQLIICTLPNEELFRRYETELKLHLCNPGNLQDTRRILMRFKDSFGNFLPTNQLAKDFLPKTLRKRASNLCNNPISWEGNCLALHQRGGYTQLPARLGFLW